jgi:hypothetical protein
MDAGRVQDCIKFTRDAYLISSAHSHTAKFKVVTAEELLTLYEPPPTNNENICTYKEKLMMQVTM